MFKSNDAFLLVRIYTENLKSIPSKTSIFLSSLLVLFYHRMVGAGKGIRTLASVKTPAFQAGSQPG